MIKRILILGATGSVGTQVLNILKKDKQFSVVGISFFQDVENKSKDIFEIYPAIQNYYCNLENKKSFLKANYCNSLEDLTTVSDFDYLFVCTPGIYALKSVEIALEKNKKVFLANKEILVMAGFYFQKKFKNFQDLIIPIDSEHCSIIQCLKGKKSTEVSKIFLTMSGGSLRNVSYENLDKQPIEKIISHPNWSMGPKITLDSATLINKMFEIIEAYYLFNIDINNIFPLLHFDSIAHGIVQFKDKSFLYAVSHPSMHLAIQQMLYSEMDTQIIDEQSFDIPPNIIFQEPSHYCNEVLKIKNFLSQSIINGIILCASNDACIELFLNKTITFTSILKIILENLEIYKTILPKQFSSIEDIENYYKKVYKFTIKTN